MEEENKEKKVTRKRTTTKKTTTNKPKRTYTRRTTKQVEPVVDESIVEDNNISIEELEYEDINHESKVEENTKSNKESDEVTTNATFNLLEVIIIILITGVVVSIISGLIVYNNYSKIKNLENTNKTITQSELDEFTDNYNIIINNYVDDVDKKELLDAAISGMYHYLGDEYSTYIDKSSTDTLSD